MGPSPGPNKKMELKGSKLVFVRLLMKTCRSGKTKMGPVKVIVCILCYFRLSSKYLELKVEQVAPRRVEFVNATIGTHHKRTFDENFGLKV